VEETACLIIHQAVSKKRFDRIYRQAKYRGSKFFSRMCYPTLFCLSSFFFRLSLVVS
jgi:hypothetical protein